MNRLIAGAFVVLLVGCGAAPTSTPVTPTAVVSPTPTATPTPSPSPIAGRDAEIAFLTRALAGNQHLLDLYDKLVAATNTSNSAVQLNLAAREMSDWTDQERTWLLGHEAAPCFKGAWDAYLGVVEAYRTLADLTTTAAADPENDLAQQTAARRLRGAVRSWTAADSQRPGTVGDHVKRERPVVIVELRLGREL